MDGLIISSKPRSSTKNLAKSNRQVDKTKRDDTNISDDIYDSLETNLPTNLAQSTVKNLPSHDVHQEVQIIKSMAMKLKTFSKPQMNVTVESQRLHYILTFLCASWLNGDTEGKSISDLLSGSGVSAEKLDMVGTGKIRQILSGPSPTYVYKPAESILSRQELIQLLGRRYPRATLLSSIIDTYHGAADDIVELANSSQAYIFRANAKDDISIFMPYSIGTIGINGLNLGLVTHQVTHQVTHLFHDIDLPKMEADLEQHLNDSGLKSLIKEKNKHRAQFNKGKEEKKELDKKEMKRRRREEKLPKNLTNMHMPDIFFPLTLS